MYQEPRRLLQAALRTVDGTRKRGEARVPPMRTKLFGVRD